MAKTFTIGREASNDIVLTHPSISLRHASITSLKDGRILIRDLNSSNGVWVNNRRVASFVVEDIKRSVGIADFLFEIPVYFNIKKNKLISTRDPSDFSDSFDRLEKIEKSFEEELGEITKSSGKYMLYFRISIMSLALVGIASRWMSQFPIIYTIFIYGFIGLISVYFYKAAMAANSEKEKKRRRAREDYKIDYVCPQCERYIVESTYIIKKKDQYNCKYCKVTIYKSN